MLQIKYKSDTCQRWSPDLLWHIEFDYGQHFCQKIRPYSKIIPNASVTMLKHDIAAAAFPVT